MPQLLQYACKDSDRFNRLTTGCSGDTFSKLRGGCLSLVPAGFRRHGEGCWGGRQIDLRFGNKDQGNLAVVVAPVLRFADVGFNADVRIEELGGPDRIISGFAPELFGTPLNVRAPPVLVFSSQERRDVPPLPAPRGGSAPQSPVDACPLVFAPGLEGHTILQTFVSSASKLAAVGFVASDPFCSAWGTPGRPLGRGGSFFVMGTSKSEWEACHTMVWVRGGIGQVLLQEFVDLICTGSLHCKRCIRIAQCIPLVRSPL